MHFFDDDMSFARELSEKDASLSDEPTSGSHDLQEVVDSDDILAALESTAIIQAVSF
jgi:hypothetical protein